MLQGLLFLFFLIIFGVIKASTSAGKTVVDIAKTAYKTVNDTSDGYKAQDRRLTLFSIFYTFELALFAVILEDVKKQKEILRITSEKDINVLTLLVLSENIFDICSKIENRYKNLYFSEKTIQKLLATAIAVLYKINVDMAQAYKVSIYKTMDDILNLYFLDRQVIYRTAGDKVLNRWGCDYNELAQFSQEEKAIFLAEATVETVGIINKFAEGNFNTYLKTGEIDLDMKISGSEITTFYFESIYKQGDMVYDLFKLIDKALENGSQ